MASLGFQVVIERHCLHAESVGSTPSSGFVQLYVLAKFGETLYEDDSYALKLYFCSLLIAQIFCAQVAVYKIAATSVCVCVFFSSFFFFFFFFFFSSFLFFVLFHRCIIKTYNLVRG